jgi:hypothetical protein
MEDDNQNINNVEEEDLGYSEKNRINPNSLRIKSISITVDYMLSKIANNDLNLSANFNRNRGLWTNVQQSRFIESILLRFPLPIFYFDGSNYENWLVIDGLQRLNSLKRFIIDNDLVLKGMEFLVDIEGKKWSDLSRPLQRQIEETILQCYIIEEGDEYAKFNILKRINTSGVPYSNQEIRLALNNKASQYLRELAESNEFIHCTQGKVRTERLSDLEFINRFLAFYMLDYESEYPNDLDYFMNMVLVRLEKIKAEEWEHIVINFKKAMNLTWDIFNENAFSKNPNGHTINKAIFEIISSNFAKLSDMQISKLLSRKKEFKKLFFNSIEGNFKTSLSVNTGTKSNVIIRHQEFKKIIHQITNE